MPKVTGPLFSLAASGTYRNELTFRTNTKGTHVFKSSPTSKPRTQNQIETTGKVADLAAAWSDLPEFERIRWRNRAPAFSTTGRRLWWKQWFSQGSTTENPPVLP